MMNILIIGNGGREHALAWKAAQSPQVGLVYVAPGNAGTELEQNIININIRATDIHALKDFALAHQIDLTIVGPESSLVLGVVDLFQAAGLTIFGPTQAAAQLEGSKSFAKDFLARHQIPTAQYKHFTDLTAAMDYLHQQHVPIVIKADGLAAGKGVVVAMTMQEAENAVHDMLAGNAFGEAGHRVVIEEFLYGEEASFIVMVDGLHVLPMATSQDHKRVGNGDTGPNTGGMGAYSPAPVVTAKIHQRIMDEIIWPTVHGMAKDGIPYRGFLYAGLMISPEGEPKVIEFNCRFGDPETQPIMMRLRSDLIALCLAGTQGELQHIQADWDHRPALGVVLAAQGYPEQATSGDVIDGLSEQQHKDEKIFHAGSRIVDGKVVTNGGRVLCITALGKDIAQAQCRAYQIAASIHWPGCFYRTDIGYRAIQR